MPAKRPSVCGVRALHKANLKKLVASILWRLLMAAHVLISFTLLFSPIVVAVMRFLALYQSLLLNLHVCIRRQHNTKHNRAQFGLVIVSNNNKTPST